jgi:hypothetical protein
MTNMLKAIGALLLAIAATIVVGAFLGFPPDPERTTAQVAIAQQVLKDGPNLSHAEFEARVRVAMQRNPALADRTAEPAAISILKMHPWVLAVALAALLFVFRPGLVAAGAVSLTAAAAFGVSGWFLPGMEMLVRPAFALVAALAVYLVARQALRLNRTQPAP